MTFRSVRSLRVAAMATAFLAMLAAAGPAAAQSTPLTAAQAQQLGSEAYVYGVPLLAYQRQQHTQTSVTVPNALSDAPLNQLGNQRALADASHQVFVAPNNDTLYTNGHLDLSKGPLVLHIPKIAHQRYYTFQFLDPYTNVFHYVGTRTTGNGGGDYAIVGPNFTGKLPRGVHRIDSPYTSAWVLGRTHVNGAADLKAAHRVQDGYRLIPLQAFEQDGLKYQAPRPKRVVTTHTQAQLPTGLAFFDALGQALADNPPPARDKAVLSKLEAVGIGPGLQPSKENLSPEILQGLRAAADAGPQMLTQLRARIAMTSMEQHRGWYVQPSDIGNFGTDYQLRAVIGYFAIAANRPEEAIYPTLSVDNTGAMLNGASRYVLHIPKGGFPPAKYFWSFTLYNSQMYLAANPIDRYAINQFTKGLKYNADGSLDIYVQSDEPAGHASNWLPAPASGGFDITLRIYGPKPSALNGTYAYPTLTKVA